MQQKKNENQLTIRRVLFENDLEYGALYSMHKDAHVDMHVVVGVADDIESIAGTSPYKSYPILAPSADVYNLHVLFAFRMIWNACVI